MTALRRSTTPSSGALRPRVDGVRRFAVLSLVGGTAAVLGGVYALTGRGVPCPFLALTGWWCPVCGSSRMGVALLRGDVAAAWGWNPFMLVLGGLLAAIWAWTGVRLVARRPAGLPGPLAVLDRLSPTALTAVIIAPALVFMVVRNVF